MAKKPALTGREIIYSDVDAITRDNVVSVLQKAKTVHEKNVEAINYLWDMYRGKQEILNRHKEVRKDIENKIVENRAYQIVTFETGYLVGKPIQYVSSRLGDSDGVKLLNDFMVLENKATDDQELVLWQKICGTAYRFVFPKSNNLPGESPFEIHAVEPQSAFVIYSSKIGHAPLSGVFFYKNSEDETVYSVYTRDKYFEITEEELTVERSNALGLIPLIEYPANRARLGSIEVVAPLLDELNTLDSNRIDGVEQFVQALLVFVNCQPPEEETSSTLAEKGIIALNSIGENKADVKMIAEQLNQSQTQVLKDDIYQSILEIVGMPSISSGNTSDSSNNGAVILKNGWQNAEAKAEASENVFRKSEREMLSVVLRICRDLVPNMPEISLANVQIHFPRQNYGDLQSKAQVLVTMLNNDKIAPKLAFEACRIWNDVEDAFAESMRWYAEQTAALEKSLTDETDDETDEGDGEVVAEGENEE